MKSINVVSAVPISPFHTYDSLRSSHFGRNWYGLKSAARAAEIKPYKKIMNYEQAFESSGAAWWSAVPTYRERDKLVIKSGGR